MMSPWLFNLYMDGVIREMKAKIGDIGVEMCVNGGKSVLNTTPFSKTMCKKVDVESECKQKQGDGA